MRIFRLASLLTAKYKFSEDAVSLENSLRKQLSILWNYPHKLFPILEACAQADIKKVKDPHEKKALAGHKFCKQLLELVDLLKEHSHAYSLGQIREMLLVLVNLINENKNVSFDPNGKPTTLPSEEMVAVQFPHVSALVSELIPISRRSDVKLRNDMQGKARTGLSRIFSLSSTLLDEIQHLEIMVPEKFTHDTLEGVDINQETPNRFSPQRAPLARNDIIDFIRQHGDQYGLSSTEDWATVFEHDPVLKERITSVINALNRGHAPVDALAVKEEIKNILQKHKELQQTNAHLFKETE